MEDRNKKFENNDLRGTDDTEQKINNILKIFAESFVKNFEKKSKHYYNLALGKDEKSRRNVKTSTATAVGTISKALRFFGAHIWNHSNRKRAVNLVKQPFYKNPDKIREILVNAAVCIFASYESQFINKNINREKDIKRISMDAVERCLNYYKKSRNVMDSSSAAITKGIIRGRSKEVGKKFPFKAHKVKKTYAGNLFQKVGLVTLAPDGQPDNYYKKKRGSAKHGYRLLLDRESESIYRAYLLNVEYRREKPPRITKYKYSLNSELIKKYSEEILNDINKNYLGLT